MIYNLDSQLAAFLAREPYEALVDGPDEPQVIFRGALELNREKEMHMVERLFTRMGELELESGLADIKDGGTGHHSWTAALGESATDFDIDSLSFMAKQQFWELVYNQKFAWRKERGGIWDIENPHFPMTRRAVTQQIAKAQNHFFAQTPWCNSLPVGMDDVDDANACNEFVQHKFKEGGIRLSLMKAIEKAAIAGQAVVKRSHREDAHYPERYASVLVGSDKSPIIAADNSYIIEDTDNEWIMSEGGGMVLKRDGVTPQPASLVWQRMKIRQRIVTKSAPEAKLLRFQDFLAPLNSPDLQACDVCCEFYDVTAIDLVEQFRDRMQESGVWDDKEYPRTMEFLRSASVHTKAGAAAGKGRLEYGETREEIGKSSEPMIRVVEFHAWFDATQTGRLDKIVVIVDRETKRPILYDHVANVYPGGNRPYTPIVWKPIDGRWTGTGACEELWKLQELIDIDVARWSLSISDSGSVTFFNASLTEEGINNPDLNFNDHRYLTKRDVNTPADRILERINLHEIKGGSLNEHIQFYSQMATNMTGVLGANDARAAGLETSELATGIRNMENSGNEIFAPILVNLEPGITEVVSECQVLAVDNMNEEEAFFITGPNGLAAIKKLKAQDVQRLKWNVTLEVSGDKGPRDVAEGEAATRVALEYFGLPPQIQMALAPLYRQRLKAHKVKDVDKIIPMPTQEQLNAQPVAGSPVTSQPTGDDARRAWTQGQTL